MLCTNVFVTGRASCSFWHLAVREIIVRRKLWNLPLRMKYNAETELYIYIYIYIHIYETMLRIVELFWCFFSRSFIVSLFSYVALLPSVILHFVFVGFAPWFMHDDEISFSKKCHNYLRRPRNALRKRMLAVSSTDNDTLSLCCHPQNSNYVLLLVIKTGMNEK